MIGARWLVTDYCWTSQQSNDWCPVPGDWSLVIHTHWPVLSVWWLVCWPVNDQCLDDGWLMPGDWGLVDMLWMICSFVEQPPKWGVPPAVQPCRVLIQYSCRNVFRKTWVDIFSPTSLSRSLEQYNLLLCSWTSELRTHHTRRIAKTRIKIISMVIQ